MVDKSILRELRTKVKESYNVKYGQLFNHDTSVKLLLTNISLKLYQKGLSTDPLSASNTDIWSYLYNKYSNDLLKLFKEELTGIYNFQDPLYLEYKLSLIDHMIENKRHQIIHKEPKNNTKSIVPKGYLELIFFREDLKLILEYQKLFTISQSIHEIVGSKTFSNTAFKLVSTFHFEDLSIKTKSYEHLNRRFNAFYVDSPNNSIECCNKDAFYNNIDKFYQMFLDRDKRLGINKSNYDEYVRVRKKVEKFDLGSNWTLLGLPREEEIKYIKLIMNDKIKPTQPLANQLLDTIKEIITFIPIENINHIFLSLEYTSIMSQLDLLEEDETLAYFSYSNVYKRKSKNTYSMYLPCISIDYDNEEFMPPCLQLNGMCGAYTKNPDIEGYELEETPYVREVDGSNQLFYRIKNPDKYKIERILEKKRPLILSNTTNPIIRKYNRAVTLDTDDIEYFNLDGVLRYSLKGVNKTEVNRVANYLKKQIYEEDL